MIIDRIDKAPLHFLLDRGAKFMGVRIEEDPESPGDYDKLPSIKWKTEPFPIDSHEKIEQSEYTAHGYFPIEAGIWVLDLDEKGGKSGKGLLGELLNYPAWIDYPDQLDTIYIDTPNGCHIYFDASAIPEKIREIASNNIGKILGVDVRCGRSGWIVAPGSLGFCEATEEWKLYVMHGIEVKPPPQELIDLLMERYHPGPNKEKKEYFKAEELPEYLRDIPKGFPDNIGDDDKDAYFELFNLAKELQNSNEGLDKIVPVIYPNAKWNSNDERWHMGDIQGSPKRKKGTAYISADFGCGDWASADGVEYKDDLINMVAKARGIDKINSARLIVNAAGIPDPTAKLIKSNGGAVPLQREAEPIPPDAFHNDFTDLGNADRLIRKAGYQFRYNHTAKAWMYWNGQYWQKDEGPKISAITIEAIRDIKKELSLAPDDKTYKATMEWAKASQGIGHYTAMQTIAAQAEGIAIDNDAMETHLDFFNCQNGMVNLRSGALVPHDPGFYFTRIGSASYDPSATCPKFLAFLDEIMLGREDLIHWLQVYFGYCLTGSVKQQIFAFFYGTGRNGKSALMDIVRGILSSKTGTGYFGTMRPEALMDSKYKGPESESLASAFGLRFVMASESDPKAHLSVPRLKEIAGGDPIQCRKLYENSFSYLPTWKAVLLTNHKPTILTQDEGTWRRLRYVPFDYTCPPEHADPNLADTILKEEASGVLAWMVAGAVEWYKSGMPACKSIEDATNDYREDQDILSGFFADDCILGPSEKVSATSLLEAWKKWATANGESTEWMNKKSLWNKLADRLAIKRIKDPYNRRVTYLGISLKSEKKPEPHPKVQPDLDDDPPF